MTDTELLDLTAAFSTPLYIFDDRIVRRRVDLIKNACPASTELCFAVKANPFLIPQLSRLVPRLEVCSPGELAVCDACAVDPGRIVVSGVYKDPAVMAELVRAPALPHRFTIESITQLEMLNRLACEHGRILPALIRLSSGNQFGVDRDTLHGIIARKERYSGLAFQGIQFFSGTQKPGAKRIVRELERLDALLEQLSDEVGWQAAELEYGPGLPVAYFSDDEFDETELLGTVGTALASLRFGELGICNVVASCGTYLTRVVDTKHIRNQQYAIVDGGIHHLVYYGQSMAMRQPPCRVLSTSDARGASEVWSIFGSLCTANDILAKQVTVPGLKRGNILAFERTGAYSMTEGISLFLSRDLPSVVTVDATGHAHLDRSAVPTYPFNTPRR